MSSSSSTDPTIAALEKAKELDQLRKEQEEVIVEINKIHKKLLTNPDVLEKSGDAILQKLRALYVNAKELAETEVTTVASLLALLDTLPLSVTSAAQRRKIDIEQKRKRMKSESDMSRLPPTSMRNHPEHSNLKGEQVAARVTSDEERAEWFVVKVIHYDKDTKEYEVLDEDPGDDEESVQNIISTPKQRKPTAMKKNLVTSEEDANHELEILKAVAQAWHGHSGNPRPATEFDALRTDSDRNCRRPSRFRMEAMKLMSEEVKPNWDFSQSLWDSYEIVTISKKLESSMALDHPMNGVGGPSRGGKRWRESKRSLRNLFRAD